MKTARNWVGLPFVYFGLVIFMIGSVIAPLLAEFLPLFEALADAAEHLRDTGRPT